MYSLPKVAFEVLVEAELYYKANSKFSDEILQSLHSVFGCVFSEALELLERPKIIRYDSNDGKNHFYTLTKDIQQFVVFKDINFCNCDIFKIKVLNEHEHLTCQHVLAVKLAEISNNFTVDIITPEQLAVFMESELRKIKGKDA